MIRWGNCSQKAMPILMQTEQLCTAKFSATFKGVFNYLKPKTNHGRLILIFNVSIESNQYNEYPVLIVLYQPSEHVHCPSLVLAGTQAAPHHHTTTCVKLQLLNCSCAEPNSSTTKSCKITQQKHQYCNTIPTAFNQSKLISFIKPVLTKSKDNLSKGNATSGGPQ